MRPRKIVVVYSADPNQAGIWSFALHTNGFIAVAVSTVAELAQVVSDQANILPDGVLICVPMVEVAAEILKQTPRFSIGTVLSVTAEIVHPPDWLSNGFIHTATARTESVLNALKVATARKRGPRKFGPAPDPVGVGLHPGTGGTP